ncbi:MAG: hypothetical protein LBL82_07900 [Oscillospiraceae bacterium]|jgi:hypothetical protein|nr:hypothetical protein [Oscillospiraceae bacterium]
MARRFSNPFQNPYIDPNSKNGEAGYNFDIVMEEARERLAGRIRPKARSFELSKEHIFGNGRPNRPDRARFKIDIKNDFNGQAITPQSLESMKYSSSYRPTGNVGDKVTDTHLSSLKYAALAGRKQAPPRDLSFLSDPQSRYEVKGKKELSKRRDTERLSEPTNVRRDKLLQMLPEEQREIPEEMAEEILEKSDMKQRALGKIIEPREKKKRFSTGGDLSVLFGDRGDPAEQFKKRELDAPPRAEKLPAQDGMEENNQQLPEFYSETRNWSEIDSENPSWSEIQQHTVTIVPKPQNDRKRRAEKQGRFVDDFAYDPNNRYRPIPGMAPRRMPMRRDRSQYDPLSMYNPHAADRRMSPEELRDILAREEHGPGNLLPPEGITKPELINAWYDTYSAAFRAEEDREARERFKAQYENPVSRYRGMRQPAEAQRHPASEGRRYQKAQRSFRRTSDSEEMRRRQMEAARRGYDYAQGVIEENKQRELEAQRQKLLQMQEAQAAQLLARQNMQAQRIKQIQQMQVAQAAQAQMQMQQNYMQNYMQGYPPAQTPQSPNAQRGGGQSSGGRSGGNSKR